MILRLTKSIVTLVIALMMFECVTAAFVQTESNYLEKSSVHEKSSSASLLASILFEKTEEEERNEEVRDRIGSIELADFSKIAIFLSQVHTPHTSFILFEHRFDTQTGLFKRYCVFLI